MRTRKFHTFGALARGAAAMIAVSAFTGCGAADEPNDSDPPATDQPTVGTTRQYIQAVKPSKTEWGPGVSKDRIVIKFAEGARVRLRSGSLAIDASKISARETNRLGRLGLTSSSAQKELGPVRALLEGTPGVAVRRLFSVAEADLDAQQDSGESASGAELADLNLFYDVNVPADRAPAIVDVLNASNLVELAYPAPVPVSPSATDIMPPSSSSVNNQFYLNAAPLGLDARYSWTRSGGTGTNVRIIDVEFAWLTTHEDLGAGGTNTPVVSLRHNGVGEVCRNPDGTQIYDDHHGTAVLGELAAANNSYGVTGIAYGARYGTSGVYSGTCSGFSVADAITVAATSPNTSAGDVILVEQQALGVATCPQATAPPCGWTNTTTPHTCRAQYGLVPVEYRIAEFNAIQTATANGRVVVEAASNGEQNLDAGIYNNLFKRTTRDSGAIIVGAGDSNRQPICFSNWGDRLDVQGLGTGVTTTGYGVIQFGMNDPRQWYTTGFNGTSSASPMVAAAAADIQAARKAAGQAVLTPSALRTLLSNTGTLQATPVVKRIGSLPNLRAALSPAEPPAAGEVVSVQQTSTLSTVFAVGSDGLLYRRANSGSGWQAPAVVPLAAGQPKFSPGAKLATGFQGTGQLDVFGIDTSTVIKYSRSTNGGAFSQLAAVSSALNPLPWNAGLATGIRNGNELHVFVVNPAGTLVSYSVIGTGTTWTGPNTIAANFAPPGAPLATGRQGTNQLDVFAIGTDGALKAAFALDGINGWLTASLTGTNVAFPGARLATGRQGTDQLDVFFVDGNGVVESAFVLGQGDWCGILACPIAISPANTASSGAPIWAANHGTNNDTLDVYTVSPTSNAATYVRIVGALGTPAAPVTVTNTSGHTLTSLATAAADRGTNILDLIAIGTNGISVSTSTNGGAYSTFTKLP